MKKFNWMLTFDPMIFWLWLTGLWPKKSYRFDIYTFYGATCVSLFMICHTFCQAINIFMVEMDFKALAASMFVSAHIIAAIKICAFMNNLKLMKRLIVKVNSFVFQPKHPDQVEIVQGDLKLWITLYRMYQGSVGGLVSFWLLRPLLDGSYQNYDLPFFAWYPFNVKISPNYQIVYIYQIVSIMLMATAHMNVDALMIGFMVYIGAQCDILCDNLRQFGNNEDLISSIKHHKEILTFCADFNDFFGSIIFGQFLTSVVTLALGLFKLSLTVPGSPEFYILVTFFCTVTLEIFLYCWYGNQVEVKSSNVPFSAFESKWNESSLKCQKILLLFLTRTQQEISITAFNMFPLSLKTFMTIMRTSWSYFAVLRQMNSRN